MKNAHERFGKLVYRRVQKRRQPTSAFSWMPLWERIEARPLGFTGGGDVRSAPWQQRLPTVTHLP